MKQIIAIGGGGFSKYGEYSPINNLIEDQLTRVVRANKEGSAYKVEKSNQKIHEEKLESTFIGDLL